MDFELLIALCTMWTASTLSVVVFFIMWFFNEGEAFHPHSVDVEQRHAFLAVSAARTECKYDCAVKSISAFAAPRGSSASKLFSVSCVMVAIAGILGSARWHKVGDATYVEMCLAITGFASLLLVAFFELDVVPERYLEDKLMVTSWLMEKQQTFRIRNNKKKAALVSDLPFSLNCRDPRFLSFIRQSPGLYHLFEEDVYLQHRNLTGNHNISEYHILWFSLHLIGATGFASCCTAAVLLYDAAQEPAHAFVVASTFCFFGGLGYLTGGYYAPYLPVLKCVRGWIIVWNPFVREPHFMLKLEEALDECLAKQQGNNNSEQPTACSSDEAIPSAITSNDTTPLRRRKPNTEKPPTEISSPTVPRIGNQSTKEVNPGAAKQADLALDSIFLRCARSHPQLYLKTVGHLLVMSELIALLTPLVAMGLQWVTALCDGPPVDSLLELVRLFLGCLKNNDCASSTFAQSAMEHCILKQERA